MNIFHAVIMRKSITVYLGIIIIVTSMGCFQKGDPSFQQGKKLYERYCTACHGVNGGGVLYSKSALNNDVFISGEPNEVITVILFGREGAGTMPGWSMTLNDQEVAAVATYIRQAWSNRADAVTPAMVMEIRNKGAKSFSTNPRQ